MCQRPHRPTGINTHLISPRLCPTSPSTSDALSLVFALQCDTFLLIVSLCPSPSLEEDGSSSKSLCSLKFIQSRQRMGDYLHGGCKPAVHRRAGLLSMVRGSSCEHLIAPIFHACSQFNEWKLSENSKCEKNF